MCISEIKSKRDYENKFKESRVKFREKNSTLFLAILRINLTRNHLVDGLVVKI